MCKAKLAVLCVLAVSLLVWNGIAYAGIIDPCNSYCEVINPLSPCCLFVCPFGDTPSFVDQPSTGTGWYIRICLQETSGAPVPNVPPSDFWLIDCDPGADLALCAGGASVGADSMTNANGYTTMRSSVLAAGGCVDGVSVVAQNNVLLDTLTCTTPICHDVNVRSPDIDGSLCVNLVDLSIFAASYEPAGGTYDTCCDFNCDGSVILDDLSNFAFHFGPPGHSCSPPGCP